MIFILYTNFSFCSFEVTYKINICSWWKNGKIEKPKEEKTNSILEEKTNSILQENNHFTVSHSAYPLYNRLACEYMPCHYIMSEKRTLTGYMIFHLSVLEVLTSQNKSLPAYQKLSFCPFPVTNNPRVTIILTTKYNSFPVYKHYKLLLKR